MTELLEELLPRNASEPLSIGIHGRIQHIKLAHTIMPCCGISVSATGRLVACGSWGGIELWDARVGKSLFGFLHASSSQCQFYNICFSHDERYVAALSRDYHLSVWDTKSGRLAHNQKPESTYASPMVQEVPGKPLVPVLWLRLAIAFSEDGRYVIVATSPKSLDILEVTNGFQRVRKVKKGPDALKAIAPNGSVVISTSCTAHNCLQVWGATSGKTIGVIPADHTISQWDTLYFSPDSQRIIHFYFSYGHNLMQTWSIRHPMPSMKPVPTCTLHPEYGPHRLLDYPEFPPSFSSDGSTMFLSKRDGCIGVWKIVSMECIWELQMHTYGGVRSAISLSGVFLATIVEGRNDLRLWRMGKTKTGGVESCCALAR